MLGRQLDCDILVTGHTHSFRQFVQDGRCYVNPGSVTGAYSALQADSVPSFILMDLQVE